jgi:hypothetical protein
MVTGLKPGSRSRPLCVCGGGGGWGGGLSVRQCPDSTEGPASSGFGSQKTTTPLPSPPSPLKGLGLEMNIF